MSRSRPFRALLAIFTIILFVIWRSMRPQYNEYMSYGESKDNQKWVQDVTDDMSQQNPMHYYNNHKLEPTGNAKLGKQSLPPPKLRETLLSSNSDRDAYLDFLEKSRDLATVYQDRIIRDAESFSADKEVWSVILKDQAPASNDKHDYLSLARYFWPETQADGSVIYVRKDGFRNPEVETVNDYFIMRKMFKAVQTWGYAFFFSGNETYAEHAIYRLNEWFVNPETKMNPHLKYASMVKGNRQGRRVGVLDGYMVYRMFSGIPFLKQSPHWTLQLTEDLHRWFTRYYEWLSTSNMGRNEYKALNNHGTYCSLQYIVVVEYLGRIEEAKTLIEDALKRRWGVIDADGLQPLETDRATSWYYSSYNLQGLMLIAEAAQRLGMGRKAWDFVGENGGSIRQALLYLAQFVKDPKDGGIGNGWPHKNLDGYESETALERLERNLEFGYLMYGEPELKRALGIIRKRRPTLKLKILTKLAADQAKDDGNGDKISPEISLDDITSGTEPYSVKWGCRMSWNSWTAISITACT